MFWNDILVWLKPDKETQHGVERMPFLIKITMTVLQQRNCFLRPHVWELTEMAIVQIGEFGHIGKETQSKEARIALSHSSMFKSVLVASFAKCMNNWGCWKWSGSSVIMCENFWQYYISHLHLLSDIVLSLLCLSDDVSSTNGVSLGWDYPCMFSVWNIVWKKSSMSKDTVFLNQKAKFFGKVKKLFGTQLMFFD